MADEEKQESCTGDDKYERNECESLPKPQSQLAQLHDDDEDVFATSLIDRICC